MTILPGKRKIIEVLSKWNPWNEKEISLGIYRENYVKNIEEYIETGKVVTVTGIRRSGKSTILKQTASNLIKKGISPNDILMINFEEVEFGEPSLELLLKIYDAYQDIIQPKGKPYIFLDEIQNVKKWERFVRTLNERKEANFIISGSNSKLLSKEYGTVLTGRQLYIKVFPLTFQEYLYFKGLNIRNEKDIIFQSLKIRQKMNDYMNEGGFPEITLLSSKSIKKNILRSYLTDIIEKDISSRYNLRKLNILKTLVRYYLSNFSKSITFNKITKFLNATDKTIAEYSHYLEEANLIFFLNKFSFGLKAQERSPKKVYSIDLGFPATEGMLVLANTGWIIENIVAIQLKINASRNPDLEIYYWKDKSNRKEVDFLIKKGRNTYELIQVSKNLTDKNTKKRETSALLLAMKEFKLKQGMIITEDLDGSEVIDSFKITYIPLWKWLL